MKNLQTRVKRVISTFLCTSLLFCSIIGVNAKSTYEQEKQDISSQSISLLSGETIDMINPYVSMDDDKFVLNLPTEVSDKLTSVELKLVTESINNANSFIT